MHTSIAPRRSIGRLVGATSIATLLLGLLAAPLHAQNATLTGSVLADSSEKPLANAEIVVADVKGSVKSDARGAFAVNGIKPGKHQITIRLLGYEAYTADITFAAGQKVEADFLLKPASTKLEKVDVKGKANGQWGIKLQDFEEHRKANSGGRFFTADEFEKNQGRLISDFLMGRIPGVRRVNVQHTSVRPLAGRVGSNYNCYISISLNGVTVYNALSGTNFFDIDNINSGDVIGAEYYSIASIPLRFSGPENPCGLLVLWTK